MNNKEILMFLEENYTCGNCIYLACAIARKYNTSISAYIFYEDENNKIKELNNCKNFNDIPKNLHDKLIIDHMYARKNNYYYDVYGETKNPEAIGEKKSTLINMNENDIFKITKITKEKLDEEIKLAYNDIDKFLLNRFKSLNKNKKNKLK